MSDIRAFILCALTLAALAALGNEEKNEKPPVLNIGGIDDHSGGTITGIVKFRGEKPPPVAVALKGNAFCEKCYPNGPPPDEQCVLGINGTENVLQNVLIYVSKGLEGKSFVAPKTPAVLDQVGCVYKPHVIAVMVGQSLEIRNSDGTLHNVMANAQVNTPFNTGMPGEGTITKVFKEPELKIKFQCFMHKWMQAYVHVIEHPFHAITQSDGTFTLKGLPPGDYELTAVHEWYNLQPDQETVKVKVSAGESTKAEFTYSLKK